MKKTNRIIISVIILGFFFLSVGYSSLTTVLTLGGTALVAGESSLKIETVSGAVLLNDATEAYTPNYSDKTITMSGDLPNLDSTISYYITFKNTTEITYDYDGINELAKNNVNVSYETIGLNTGFLIIPHSEATIKVTIKYLSVVTVLPSDTDVAISFEFLFLEHQGLASAASYTSNGLVLNLRGYDFTANGKWVDATTNHHEFTIFGDVYQDPTKNMYVFDGSGDYLTGTLPFIPATGDFTLETYIETQSAAFGTTVDQTVISQVANASNSSGRFKINVKKQSGVFPNTSLITFFSNNSSAYGNSPPSQQTAFITDIALSTRYHLQLIRTDNKLYYYVNNVLTNTVNIEADASISQENMKIGRFNDANTQYLKGNIFAIRVYNRALSDNELETNYTADLENYPTEAGVASNERLVDEAVAYSYATAGEGLYADVSGKLIFKGSNPKNYLQININDDDGSGNITTTSETYRIISFFPNKIARLLKISNPFTSIAYDTEGLRDNSSNTYCNRAAANGCNAWTEYGLLSTVNGQKDGVAASGNVGTEASLNIYLNTTYYDSLDSRLRDIMVDGIYNVGGVDLDADYSLAKSQETSKTWTGKVGLMSLVDTMEAGLVTSNLDVGGISGNYITARASSTINYWTCTQTSHNSWDVWMVTLPSTISKRRASRINQDAVSFNAMPTIHINSRTIVTGTGTSADPYILNLE